MQALHLFLHNGLCSREQRGCFAGINLFAVIQGSDTVMYKKDIIILLKVSVHLMVHLDKSFFFLETFCVYGKMHCNFLAISSLKLQITVPFLFSTVIFQVKQVRPTFLDLSASQKQQMQQPEEQFHLQFLPLRHLPLLLHHPQLFVPSMSRPGKL